MLKVHTLTFNMFGVNTYIISDDQTRECIIVDPGMMSKSEENRLCDFLEANNLQPKHLVNTHLHIDHVTGNSYVSNKYGLQLKASIDDEFLGARISSQAQMFGLPINVNNVKIDSALSENDTIKIGDSEVKIICVPGHSPGSVVLHAPKERFIISGDALFQGSIGRTDLPGGDYATLIANIKNKLLSLPDDTIVYPGHGPSTTIKNEKNYNPFLV